MRLLALLLLVGCGVDWAGDEILPTPPRTVEQAWYLRNATASPAIWHLRGSGDVRTLTVGAGGADAVYVTCTQGALVCVSVEAVPDQEFPHPCVPCGSGNATYTAQ